MKTMVDTVVDSMARHRYTVALLAAITAAMLVLAAAGVGVPL